MATKTNNGWFDVDRKGLAKLLNGRGIEFVIFELIQNAWDEKDVTRVEVTLEPANEKGFAKLIVMDDAPEGFKDLRHAYTMFAESAKKNNPDQRGRFNIGEKLVLSLCKWALIITTKGTVIFDNEGRSLSKKCRDYGTTFEALIKMSKSEIEQVTKAVHRLIPPHSIRTTFNNDPIHNPEISNIVSSVLPTVLGDADGSLRRTERRCPTHLYKVADGETAFIYEMGIPVVEHDCAFHADVMQKVPLTIDRENVTPEFLRKLRTAIFNETHADLTTEEVTHEWAQTAIESKDASPEAVKDYMTKRFGEHRASWDMNDPEANSAAVAHGYTIVKGGMMSGAAWKNVKAFEAIAPAGQLFPTHPEATIATDMVDPTSDMIAVAEYAKKLARLLLDTEIDVTFCKQPSYEAACWGSRLLRFNVHNLGGNRWFDLENNRERIDDLIIHEFGHHYESNHLSEKYNDALSGLAARAMAFGRKGMLPPH